MTNKVKGSDQRYQSVAASLRLLRAFLEIDQKCNQRWWSVVDLANSAGIGTRSCYRLLHALRKEGVPIERGVRNKVAFWRLKEDNLLHYLRQPLHRWGIQ